MTKTSGISVAVSEEQHKPGVSSANPKPSKARTLRLPLSSGRNNAAKTIPARHTGTLTRNSHRQEAC